VIELSRLGGAVEQIVDPSRRSGQELKQGDSRA
jgi:hypothetical protein